MLLVAIYAVPAGLPDDDEGGDRHRDGTNTCQGIPKALERFKIEYAAYYRCRTDLSLWAMQPIQALAVAHKSRNPGQVRRASFAGFLRDRRLCEVDRGGRA
jgi:hypothetical protein